jgi:hypothetical protein
MRAVRSQKICPKKKPAAKLTGSQSQDDSFQSNSSPMQNPAANPDSTAEARLNQHKPAKKTRNRIPSPQRERIIKKYVQGMGVTEISREENRNRETVAKIVNGDEVKKLVQATRAEFYGLASDAVDAVRYSLRENKDGRVGYKILMDIGVVPSQEEARNNAAQHVQEEEQQLTPYERAHAVDSFGKINRMMLALIRTVERKSEVYGSPLESVEEVFRNRTIVAVLDEITRGNSSRISMSDGIEWNRLRSLAKDVLNGKRSMRDAEILQAIEKYKGEDNEDEKDYEDEINDDDH